jgi:hypothetical protein
MRVYEPPPPPQVSFEARGHSMIGFHLGFSGDVEQSGTESSLASTLGFNVRGDVPIERYVLIGPLLQFGAWRPESAPNRNYYADLDFYLRGRIPFPNTPTSFQIWAGIPIGLTMDFLGQDIPETSGVGIGWNVGFLVGGAAHLSPKFGLFAEVGWLQHKISHDSTTGNDLDFRLTQWTFNIGFVLRN